MCKVTHVAVAILQKPNGDFLLASRPQGKPWAGWWEFPGGKIEANESPAHALTRELQEELGVTPTAIQPWVQRIYAYPETYDSPAKTVHLHFFFVTEWQGELHPHEGQQMRWQNPTNITVSPVLPANTPIMKALALPSIYAISNLAEMGEDAFQSSFEVQLKNGLKLLQFRERLCEPTSMRFAELVISLAHTYGAKIMLNGSVDLANELGADGVHLPSAELMKLEEKPNNLARPFMVAASCHNAQELTLAQKLGLDFVVLSPVKPTQSHPDASILGWHNFFQLVESVEIPVYALGGMTPNDLPHALAAGARGIAMQRAIWMP
ncbi:MAG: Nudix family hydrolase [Methylophilaceae bacterium]